jgi:hypothetical protein
MSNAVRFLYQCDNLTNVQFYSTSSSVQNINCMFYKCNKLNTVSNFNVNNFLGFNLRNDPGSRRGTFYNCNNFNNYANMHNNWKLD